MTGQILFIRLIIKEIVRLHHYSIIHEVRQNGSALDPPLANLGHAFEPLLA